MSIVSKNIQLRDETIAYLLQVVNTFRSLFPQIQLVFSDSKNKVNEINWIENKKIFHFFKNLRVLERFSLHPVEVLIFKPSKAAF